MSYSFTAYGHPNITGTHKTTIEFTKDKEIGKEASCIIGVKADFDLDKLKKAINKKINIIIKINDLSEEIIADVNPEFNDENEMVIRKTDFISERTLAVKADKGACDLNRDFVNLLKDRDSKISIKMRKI